MTGRASRGRGAFALLAGLALVCPFGARADSMDYAPREEHAAVDRNHDGSIDRGEFHVRMVEVFYHADGDRDGLLVVVELERIDEEMVHGPADRDGDGKLTLSEYVDQRFEGFDEADVDDDGLLSLQEVIDAYEGP